MKRYIFALFCILLPFLSGCGTGSPIAVRPGEVLVEDFSDLQCPACKSFNPTLIALREYFAGNEKVTFRFVHFPLEQIHEYAFHAAEAAECARDQGENAFWQFVDKVYENQSDLTDQHFLSIAQEIGLEQASFEQCLTSGDKAGDIRKTVAEARRRQVNGTPTLFVNGEQLEGNDRRYEAMVKRIETLLNAGIEDATPSE